MPTAPDGRPPPARRRDAHAEPWRFAMLLAAPHRLAFFIGASMLTAVSLWWLLAVGDALSGAAWLRWRLAPAHAHALTMSFSYMPMFFAGFILTAGPRWLSLPRIDASALLPTALVWLGGWTAFLVGVHSHAPVAAVGLAAVAAAWSAFCSRFLGLLRISATPDRTHLRVIAFACTAGAAALWTAATAIALEDPVLLQRVVSPALWWFLAPVFAAALHRMVPFFGVAAPTLDRRYTNWLLWTWLALLALQPPIAWRLAEGDGLTLIAAIVDAAAAAWVLWLIVRWRTTSTLRIRLLAMLFVGFAWLGVAFALQAAHAALVWNDAGAASLRLAPVHALTMGFFGSTILAMVSRMTCGQSARSFHAEHIVWLLFLALQAATVLRILSVVWPFSPALLLAAALTWTLAMLIWSLRYIGWYGRPRADGRPG